MTGSDVGKFSEGGPVPGVVCNIDRECLFWWEKNKRWWKCHKINKILRGRAVRPSDMEKSGDKYLRNIVLKHGVKEYKGTTYGQVDVYDVLEAFGVMCPAITHAIKKLLCPGLRGDKTVKQDISEAKDAVVRAFEMEEARAMLVETLRIGED